MNILLEMQQRRVESIDYNHREIILRRLLKSGLLLTVLALLPALLLAFRNANYRLLSIDLILTAVFIFTCYVKGLQYKFKVYTVLFIIYMVSVNVVLNLGFLSGAPAWFFSLPVVAALLLGMRAAVAALFLNALTLVFIGFLFYKGIAGTQGTAGTAPVFYSSLLSAFSTLGNFLLLNTVASVSIAFLVGQYERERTVRKTAELELLKSESKYRLITENINETIWTSGPDFKINYISPSCKSHLGLDPEQLLNRGLECLFDTDDFRKVISELKNEFSGIGTDRYFHKTLEIMKPDETGKDAWFEISIGTFKDEKMMPAGITGILRNITEKKNFLNQIERLKRMETLGDLAGGVAHDLNNILSGIVGYPDLILLNLPEESSIYPYIKKIRESGEKASSIVQDMLTLSGRNISKMENIELNKIIKESLFSPEHSKLRTEMQLKHHLIKIDLDLQDNIPMVNCSSNSLRKSVINLTANAMESISGNGEVKISSKSVILGETYHGRYQDIPPGRYAVISFRDSGRGITESDLSRIFEPFYTKKTLGHSGSGLGMTIVWSAVTDCGGFIDISSSSGKGTLVTLYFPAADGLQEIETDDLQDSFEIGKYMGSGEKILVVDDLESQRTLSRKIIEKLNYSVSAAESGEQALEYLEKENFDLVLLDMIMEGGMDGLDTYRKIKGLKPEQKIVIVSGYSENEKVQTAFKLGAAGFVQKPFTIETIAAAINKSLRR